MFALVFVFYLFFVQLCLYTRYPIALLLSRGLCIRIWYAIYTADCCLALLRTISWFSGQFCLVSVFFAGIRRTLLAPIKGFFFLLSCRWQKKKMYSGWTFFFFISGGTLFLASWRFRCFWWYFFSGLMVVLLFLVFFFLLDPWMLGACFFFCGVSPGYQVCFILCRVEFSSRRTFLHEGVSEWFAFFMPLSYMASNNSHQQSLIRREARIVQ